VRRDGTRQHDSDGAHVHVSGDTVRVHHEAGDGNLFVDAIPDAETFVRNHTPVVTALDAGSSRHGRRASSRGLLLGSDKTRLNESQMNVPNVSKKAHAHFIMNFIGQCVVANAPAKPHGKFRVVKSTTKPTRGFLKIVNGEYLPPAYTPSPPANNDQPDTSTNDPKISIVFDGAISNDKTKLSMTADLINNNTTSLTFYAHATTYGSAESDFNTLIGYSNNIVSPKEVTVDAMLTQSNYTFLFDKVIRHDIGNSILIQDDDSNPYYIYVFVQDSDGDRIIHKETINR